MPFFIYSRSLKVPLNIFTYSAIGGLSQLGDRVKVLLGRQVIAFPALGAYDRWRKKAKDYPLLDITVSDYLEKNATPQQREMGADLADWVVEERKAEGGSRSEIISMRIIWIYTGTLNNQSPVTMNIFYL